MSDKRERSTLEKLIMGAVIGAAVGSVIGATVAPETGKKTRRKLTDKIKAFFTRTKDSEEFKEITAEVKQHSHSMLSRFFHKLNNKSDDQHVRAIPRETERIEK